MPSSHEKKSCLYFAIIRQQYSILIYTPETLQNYHLATWFWHSYKWLQKIILKAYSGKKIPNRISTQNCTWLQLIVQNTRDIYKILYPFVVALPSPNCEKFRDLYSKSMYMPLKTPIKHPLPLIYVIIKGKQCGNKYLNYALILFNFKIQLRFRTIFMSRYILISCNTGIHDQNILNFTQVIEDKFKLKKKYVVLQHNKYKSGTNFVQ